ncbi:MAG TPA: LamG-like jellyroll fold domain-containing protein, partial [Bacteroidia bacterium]|nr:LamG-like jellyroll fold domain-containing protein [Bacteroidia bacterium]
MKLFNSTRILYVNTILIVLCYCLSFSPAQAQAPGEYRSAASGPWAVASNWEIYNGNAWVTASIAPDFTNGLIFIRSTYTISIGTSVTIDETVVEPGGTLDASVGTLTINNGPGVDLIVDGNITWLPAASLNVTTGAQLNGATASLFYNAPSITNNGQINLNQFVMGGSGPQTINGNGAILVLLPFNNAGITLGGNQTIIDQVSFNFGKIHTGPNKLIMAPGSFFLNATSDMYVDGNVQFDYPAGSFSKTFPIGDSDGFAPVNLTLNNVTTPGGVVISTIAGTHPDILNSNINDQASLLRFWSFTNNGTGFTDASMTFNWSAVDVGGGNTANYIVGKFDTPDWTYPAVSNATSTSIDVSGVTSFSDFQAGEPFCFVNIPDANFKTALLANTAINTNSDSEIQCAEATAYTGTINVSSLSIDDLTGIEAFTGITVLNCNTNNLTSLNITALTQLTNLNCSHNQLTGVNTTGLNNLTFLDVSFNSISSVDVSSNTSLTHLYVQNNTITGINLESNPGLVQFNCDNNSLTGLNVSVNTALTYLSCGTNAITSLDVSALGSLVQLYCYSNQLTSLNVQNGNNTNFVSFDATNNPSLSCIQVDDVAYSDNTPLWTAGKDPGATFSTNCSCTSADTPVFYSWSDSQICEGNSAFIAIDEQNSSLFNNTDWVWYADSCGGTPIGTGSFIFDLQPTVTTTYYARGEGGCAPPGQCGAFTITVSPHPNITFTVSHTDASCEFNNDGTVTVSNVSGGTPPYTYEIFGGSSEFFDSNNSGVFTGLWVGNYDVSVKDASGCPSSQGSQNVTIAVTNPLVLTATPNPLFICPGGSGSISLIPSGGTPPYFINVGNYDTTSLSAGSYFFSVTDNGSCSASADVTVDVIESAPDADITASTTSLDICTGDTIVLSVPGSAGNALFFDGVDDYVEGENPVLPTGNDSRTIEAWINPASAATGNIFSWGTLGSSNSYELSSVQYSNGHIKFVAQDNDYEGNITIATGVWTHIAVTYNSNGDLKFYVNGVQDLYTFVFPSLNTTGNNFRIGNGLFQSIDNPFNGTLDEIKVFNYDLSQNEIIAHMNTSVDDFSTEMSGYYKMDEGSDTTTENSAEYYFQTAFAPEEGDGILYNGPVWVSSTAPVNTSLNFQWAPNGETTSSINATDSGIYSVTVTNAMGCSSFSSIEINAGSCILPYYPPPDEGKDTTDLGSELTQLYNNPDSIPDTTGNNIFLTNNGEVFIEVIANVGEYDNLLALLLTPQYGMHDTIPNGDTTLTITGFFPIANLPLLNNLPTMVNYVRPYYQPVATTGTGVAYSLGDVSMRSDSARKAFNVDGSGVKIGVLSDSYNKIIGDPAATDVANGDLPGANGTNPVQLLQDYPFGIRTDEGRGMLQIVHDVAPKADLAFRTGFISAGDFAEGIKALAAANCDVILDDVTYITEPFFQDGVVSKAVDEVKAAGVSYFSAAGNYGTKSYE